MFLIKGKTVIVRSAQFDEIAPITKNMRSSDITELWDGPRQKPLVALDQGFRNSDQCYTVTINDEPVAMFGVADTEGLPGFGTAWLLGTDRLDECRRDLRVYSPMFVRWLGEGYEAIGNYVDYRNKVSLKWLVKLGFRCERVKISAVSNQPFVLMVRECNHV